MNEYLKKFLHRGLIFGGFGPIIVAIIYAIIESTVENSSLSGKEMLVAILSTYLLAFVHAGASVFNQIEHWPIAKSLLFHFLTLYVVYTLCYLANSWITFEPMVLVIFSAIFVAIYFVVWMTVILCIKATEKRLNSKIG